MSDAADHGKYVVVRTADNKWLPRRAATPCVDGGDFPVVWVTDEEDWVAAHREGREVDARPWPCEDVFTIEEASAEALTEAYPEARPFPAASHHTEATPASLSPAEEQTP